ncbi:MAG: type II toxin-antitoxin system RelE/ParE family toxin [Candidatus Latescibacterota bacterium]
MIRSFGDRRTQRLFEDQVVRDFQGFARRAKRKLEALHAASRLEDLSVPRSHRLEKLGGKLRGLHSIRINDQWRLVFRSETDHAEDVRIVDYH